MTNRKHQIQPPIGLPASPLECDLVNLCYQIVQTGQAGQFSEFQLFLEVGGFGLAISNAKKLLKFDCGSGENRRLTDGQKHHFKSLRKSWVGKNSFTIFTLIFDEIFSNKTRQNQNIGIPSVGIRTLKNGSFEIEPPDFVSVSYLQHQLVDSAYRLVTTGQVSLVGELLRYKNVKGYKLATLRMESFLKVNKVTFEIGRLTQEQKNHFKKIRAEWSECGIEVVFMILLDVGFPKKLSSHEINSKDTKLARINKISPLIRNQEIANYLKRVSDLSGVGKHGVPQDKYRWRFYGSSTMDFDLWRKGDKRS